MSFCVRLTISFILLTACVTYGNPVTKNDWDAPTLEGIRTAVKNNRPIMVYFSANWCPICANVEKFIFPQQSVQDMFKRFDVFLVDGTHPSVVTSFWETYFDVQAYPTIAFVRADGTTNGSLRIVGYHTARELQEAMQRVLRN